MEKVKIKGYKTFFFQKQEYLIVLDKSVKLYDKEFQCKKIFRNIKYASWVAFDGDKAYIGTTENLIYEICLLSLEIIKYHKIKLNNSLMDSGRHFEICRFLSIDGGKKLFVTAFSLGAALMLEYDIDKKSTKLLNYDNEWGFELRSLNRLNDGISLIDRYGGMWDKGDGQKTFSLKKSYDRNAPYLCNLQWVMKKTLWRKWWRRLYYVTPDEKYYLLGERKYHFVVMNADSGVEYPLSANKKNFCSYQPECKYDPHLGIMLVIEREERRIHIIELKATEVILRGTFENFSDGVFLSDGGIFLLEENGESVVIDIVALGIVIV